MIYSFKCECGERDTCRRPMKDGAPEWIVCAACGGRMQRDWQADAPMIDTSGCRDHSEIKEGARVRSAWDRQQSPERVEHGFRRHIEKRRSEIRDAGGQRGSIKQTHAVPAHLYHGKIAETKDKNYWSDPKNLSRHKDCEVE